MKWFRAMTAFVMLAVWLPAINHCRLEQLPGLEFLSCCTHDEAAPHADDDCDTDSCPLVENDSFKVETFKISIPVPLLLPVQFDLPLLRDILPAIAANHLTPEASPPDLPHCWQFVLRAAPSPRAPSFLS